MFCKNCGSVVDEKAAVCTQCGWNVGSGVNYCAHCGQPAMPGAVVCTNCGVALVEVVKQDSKSKLAAGLLGIFLGVLGVHNFYLGYTGKAVGQLLLSVLSCGSLSVISAIWGLIEGIMILAGNIKVDGKGNPLKD